MLHLVYDEPGGWDLQLRVHVEAWPNPSVDEVALQLAAKLSVRAPHDALEGYDHLVCACHQRLVSPDVWHGLLVFYESLNWGRNG